MCNQPCLTYRQLHHRFNKTHYYEDITMLADNWCRLTESPYSSLDPGFQDIRSQDILTLGLYKYLLNALSLVEVLDWGHFAARTTHTKCHGLTKSGGFCKSPCSPMRLRDNTGYEWTSHFRNQYCCIHMKQLIPLLELFHLDFIPDICFLIGTYV